MFDIAAITPLLDLDSLTRHCRFWGLLDCVVDLLVVALVLLQFLLSSSSSVISNGNKPTSLVS
jgi:hypothetical protein